MSSTRVVEAKAGILARDSLLSLIVVTICENDGSEATWGYMVKRISAHGGCLGGQRR